MKAHFGLLLSFIVVGIAGSFATRIAAQAPPSSVLLAYGERSRFATWVTAPVTSASGSPAVVQLHGMCNDPAITCSWFPTSQLSDWWQICPRGNTACGSAYQWAGSAQSYKTLVEGALDRASIQYPSRIEGTGAVLIGYSQGALAAVSALTVLQGRFRGLVLVSASVSPDAGMLKQAGIGKVVMMAGQYDQARPTMQAAVQRLNAEGMVAQYRSLGDFGHVIPLGTSQAIADAIKWAGSPTP